MWKKLVERAFNNPMVILHNLQTPELISLDTDRVQNEMEKTSKTYRMFMDLCFAKSDTLRVSSQFNCIDVFASFWTIRRSARIASMDIPSLS